jgi:hypothetical protein
MVPEQNGKHPRNTEDEREGKEVPLLPKKIDVNVVKELHRSSPLSSRLSDYAIV